MPLLLLLLLDTAAACTRNSLEERSTGNLCLGQSAALGHIVPASMRACTGREGALLFCGMPAMPHVDASCFAPFIYRYPWPSSVQGPAGNCADEQSQ